MVVLGHIKHELALQALDGFSERLLLRALPGFGLARALLPEEFGAAAGRLAYRPRASPPSRVFQIKRLGATAAVGLLWRPASTPVRIYLPAASPPVSAMRAQVPGCKIGVFIGNAHNLGRSTLQAFDATGQLRAICRFISDSTARHHADVEYRMLQALQSRPSLADSVPVPYELVFSHLGRGVLTSALTGLPGPTQITGLLDRWLADCISTDQVDAGSTGLVKGLAERAETAPRHPPPPAVVLATVRDLSGERVRRTIVHGDFAPWNMLLDRGHLRVFDWEYGTTDGLPEWDATYFALQTGIVHDGWDAGRLLTEALAQCDQHSEHFSPTGKIAVVLLVLIEVGMRCAERHDNCGATRAYAVASDLFAQTRNRG